MIPCEFFPPKTAEGECTLLEIAPPVLRALHPNFCSIAYVAGAIWCDGTLRIVERIQRDQGATAVSPLSCLITTREQVGDVIAGARERSIARIFARPGDPPGVDVESGGSRSALRSIGRWKPFSVNWTAIASVARVVRKATSHAKRTNMPTGIALSPRSIAVRSAR